MIPDQLADSIENGNIPVAASLELTWACNLFCIHCYQYPAGENELTTSELIGILDQLHEAGCLYLALTGGEPLLRDDFFTIAEYAREKNFAISLLTNGTLIDEQVAHWIRDLGFLGVHVSLLGASAATHDSITGMPGSFAVTMDTIRLLRRLDIRTYLNTVVMRQNVHDQAGIGKIAGEVGAEQTLDSVVAPGNDGDTGTFGCRLSDTSLKEFYSCINDNDQEHLLDSRWRTDGPLCGAGIWNCAINARGEVYPCVGFPRAVGSLRQESFRAIWDNSGFLDELRQLSLSDLNECVECELKPYCFRCTALAWIEDGSIGGPSQEACRQARNLMEAGGR
ncbi:radical SAM protein [Gemmatimonadota bacterium]